MVLNDRNMTATEVAQRHEDKLAILGPVIENQNSEFLSPLIDRVYDIAEFKGLIPPPPEELEGQEIRIEYISLLASAQRMVGTQSIEQVANLVKYLQGKRQAGEHIPAFLGERDEIVRQDHSI